MKMNCTLRIDFYYTEVHLYGCRWFDGGIIISGHVNLKMHNLSSSVFFNIDIYGVSVKKLARHESIVNVMQGIAVQYRNLNPMYFVKRIRELWWVWKYIELITDRWRSRCSTLTDQASNCTASFIEKKCPFRVTHGHSYRHSCIVPVFHTFPVIIPVTWIIIHILSYLKLLSLIKCWRKKKCHLNSSRWSTENKDN